VCIGKGTEESAERWCSRIDHAKVSRLVHGDAKKSSAGSKIVSKGEKNRQDESERFSFG